MLTKTLRTCMACLIILLSSSCEDELERTNIYDRNSPNFGNNGISLEDFRFIKDVTPSGKVVNNTYPYALFTFKNKGLVTSNGKLEIDATGQSYFFSPYNEYQVEPMSELKVWSLMSAGQIPQGSIRISTTCTDEFKNINLNELTIEDTTISNQVLVSETVITGSNTDTYYFAPGGTYTVEPTVLNNTSSILSSLRLTSITIISGNEYISSLIVPQPFNYSYAEPFKVTTPESLAYTISIKPDAPENAQFVLRYNFNNGSRHSVRYIITN